MKPLQSVAMGLVIVALTARVQGYDALPDPAGWVLVLLGLRALRPAVPVGRALEGLALLATLVSVVLWFPAGQELLDEVDPSLRWAANLPQLGFVIVLCHRLAERAAGTDGPAARWWRLAEVLAVVVAVLPVLVLGGGLTALEQASYVTAGLALLLVVWLLFAHAGRLWALVREPGPAATEH